MSEKELLKEILANQVILFRSIREIKSKLENSLTSKNVNAWKMELDREAAKLDKRF